MKTKVGLILGLLICCALFSYAQVSIGVNFGANTSLQKAPSERDYLKDSGYKISASFYHPINSFLEIGIEPGFIRTEVARNDVTFNVTDPRSEIIGCFFCGVFTPIEETIFGNYFEMPILLQSRIALGGSNWFLQPKVGGGPSMMLTGKRRTDFLNQGGSEQEQKLNFREEEDLNRVNFIYHGALGFGYQFKFGAIYMETRYSYSMKEVSDNTDIQSSNQHLHFNLGYYFSL